MNGEKQKYGALGDPGVVKSLNYVYPEGVRDQQGPTSNVDLSLRVSHTYTRIRARAHTFYLFISTQ